MKLIPKRFILGISVLAIFGLETHSLRAEIGVVDAVPAATLLLPYFEVGLEESGSSATTLFSVNNATDEPVVAHVTLWTKLARPTLDFDIFLTGYDVYTVNLADLFLNGSIPQTPVFDPGAFSDPNIVPGGCDFPLPANLPSSLFSYIRNLHTGLPAPPGFSNAGLCGDRLSQLNSAAEGVAVGYITIDVVNDCSLTFPANPGYFEDGGTGIAANTNALWGDFFLVDPALGSAQGAQLAHIEARDSVQSGFWEPGDYTFYGRYLGFNASDNREPLATTWLSRYFTGNVGPFNRSTDLLTWRDTGLDDSFFFMCSSSFLPSPYPLSLNLLFVLDEDENLFSAETPQFSPPPVAIDIDFFACATNRFSIVNFMELFDIGWGLFDLSTSVGSPVDPVKQAYMVSIHSASGLFSVGYEASHLDSALEKTFTVTTAPLDVLLGP